MEKVNVYDIAVFLSIIDLPYLEEYKLIKTLSELYGNSESLKDFMMKIMNFYFKLSRERTKFIHEKTLCKNKILYLSVLSITLCIW